MATIDYDRQATISWVNRPHADDPDVAPLEEHFEGLTLRDAVIFAMDHLDAGCRKSVTIICGIEKYNLFEIEVIYRELDHRRA